MTIHHDKLAYGRLASVNENADEQKLKEMAQRLSLRNDVKSFKDYDFRGWMVNSLEFENAVNGNCNGTMLLAACGEDNKRVKLVFNNILMRQYSKNIDFGKGLVYVGGEICGGDDEYGITIKMRSLDGAFYEVYLQYESLSVTEI